MPDENLVLSKQCALFAKKENPSDTLRIIVFASLMPASESTSRMIERFATAKFFSAIFRKASFKTLLIVFRCISKITARKPLKLKKGD